MTRAIDIVSKAPAVVKKMLVEDVDGATLLSDLACLQGTAQILPCLDFKLYSIMKKDKPAIQATKNSPNYVDPLLNGLSNC